MEDEFEKDETGDGKSDEKNTNQNGKAVNVLSCSYTTLHVSLVSIITANPDGTAKEKPTLHCRGDDGPEHPLEGRSIAAGK